MTAPKTDRRILRTRALLRQALAELMQEKNAGDITVKELVAHANVNRSTFSQQNTQILQPKSSSSRRIQQQLLLAGKLEAHRCLCVLSSSFYAYNLAFTKSLVVYDRPYPDGVFAVIVACWRQATHRDCSCGPHSPCGKQSSKVCRHRKQREEN